MSQNAGLEDYRVTKEEAGTTVLELLCERLFDVSTSGLKRLVREGAVTVNDGPCAEDRVVQEGDRISLELPDDDESIVRFVAAPLEGFEVLHEDARCIVCLKPAGTSVIAERGEVNAPFLGAVIHHLQRTTAHPPRPRVVHRLDKETSGVVVFAKDRDAMRDLSEQFEKRTVTKVYLALSQGEPTEDQESGEIDLPIGPALRSGERRSRVGGRDAKDALTLWTVAERFAGYTLFRVQPRTGRQHQIRVHLEAIGFPLAVDPTYGGSTALLLSKIKPGYRGKDEETPLLSRVSLHAASLSFRSPTGQDVTVEAPLPKDFQVALKQLRKWAVKGGKNRRAPRDRR